MNAVAQHGIDSSKGPCLLNPSIVKALAMDRFVKTLLYMIHYHILQTGVLDVQTIVTSHIHYYHPLLT